MNWLLLGPGDIRRVRVILGVVLLLLGCHAFLVFSANAQQSRKAGVAATDVVDPGLSDLGLDVVFSASKKLQTTQETPSVVISFDAAEIRRRGFRNITELLVSIPEIELVDTARHSYLLLKGTPFTMVALLDGTPLVNHGDNYVFFDHLVPIELVEKVEVVLSPGGVLWGAHSLYGVVNIITRKDAAARTVEGAVLGGSFETVRGATTGRVDVGDARLHLHASYERSRGPDRYVEDSIFRNGFYGNSGRTENDPGYAASAFADLQWRGLSLQALYSQNELTAGIEESGGALLAAGYNGRLRDASSIVVLGYDRRLPMGEGSLGVNLRASVVDQPYRDEHWFSAPHAPNDLDPADWKGSRLLFEIAHQPRFSGSAELSAAWEGSQLVAGFEGFRAYMSDFVETDTDGEATITIPSRGSDTLSGYAQLDSSPFRDVNVAAGVRYTWSPSHRAALSTHGHFVYEPLDQFFVKLNFSEGFRPPSFEQRYQFPRRKGRLIGNVDLEPERTRVTEAVADWLSPLGAGWSARLRAVYSFSQMLGIIGTEGQDNLAAGGAGAVTFVNLFDEANHGATLLGDLQLPWLDATLRVGGTRHFPSEITSGQARRDFARNRAHALWLLSPHPALDASLEYGFTGARTLRGYVPSSEGLAQAPVDLPLRAYHELSLALSLRVMAGLSVSLSVRNLLFDDHDHIVPYEHLPGGFYALVPFPQHERVHGFVGLRYAFGEASDEAASLF